MLQRVRRVPQDVSGSIAVITGASSGIGRATARAFAERGASVVLAARSSDGLREVAQECEAAGGQALAVPVDVADQEAVERLAARAVERFGRIDVWVNNAAVMSFGRFEDTPPDVHRRIIEVNLFGQMHGARAVLPQFRRQGSGLLINVASLYAKVSSPYVSSYLISKFGVRGFSESLREELADVDGIRVCTILPEAVDTPIFRHAANYTGQEVRAIPPAVDPKRVAHAILRCVEHPRNEVAVGQVGHLLAGFHAAAPALYERVAPRLFEWLVFTGEQADALSGNLYQPMPELNDVTGGWREERSGVRRSIALAGGVGVAAAAAFAVRALR